MNEYTFELTLGDDHSSISLVVKSPHKLSVLLDRMADGYPIMVGRHDDCTHYIRSLNNKPPQNISDCELTTL